MALTDSMYLLGQRAKDVFNGFDVEILTNHTYKYERVVFKGRILCDVKFHSEEIAIKLTNLKGGPIYKTSTLFEREIPTQNVDAPVDVTLFEISLGDLEKEESWNHFILREIENTIKREKLTVPVVNSNGKNTFINLKVISVS